MRARQFPHDEISSAAIRASDFDRIGANMRQGWIFRKEAGSFVRRLDLSSE
jgi:hypothetical protein